MPLKLVPPRPGKTPYYAVRGTHCGVYLDRSTKLAEERKARAILAKWREEIERGELARPGEPTFLDAAVLYLKSGGDDRFLGDYDEATGAWSGIAGELGHLPIGAIDQGRIDATAVKLLPAGTPATRNRQVYTPIAAVLHHAGVERRLRRPKGWRGTRRTDWMTPDQAFRILAAAREIDAEFAVFLTLLLYTGFRLGEAIALTCDRVNLGEAWAFAPATKNGDPRTAFLPPAAVAALASHPRGLDRVGRVFRFRKCGRLYELLAKVKEKAARPPGSESGAGPGSESGASLDFVTFHVFRHTWATWMRRYAGLDTTGLVATNAWRDRQSAARYEHTTVSAESRKAMLLPVEKPGRKRVTR
ncbi:MAG: tyrosine-type recombinase/integrase [Rhizobiaceae bacterium]|nr:tyrosine-type recombinase/integrase [Rhizobiaceae bacterium]